MAYSPKKAKSIKFTTRIKYKILEITLCCPFKLIFQFFHFLLASTRNLEHKMGTVSTQLEDIQEKMYDFEQNKECRITDIA